MLERAVLLSQGGALTHHHFPGLNGISQKDTSECVVDNLYEMEKKHILTVLEKYHGDKKQASEALGMSFSNLYRRLQQFKTGVR